MIDPSVSSEIAKAVPVVVGGLLAVAGGIVAQLVTHRLAEKREERALRREHLEEIVKAIYAHMEWLDEKFRAVLFRGVEHEIRSPLRQMRAIHTLYFPELSNEVLAVMKTEAPLLQFIREQNVLRMKDLDKFLKEWDQKPYMEAYPAYTHAVNVLTARCRRLLKTPGATIQ